MAPSERDLAVWGAYLGTARVLAVVQDHDDVAQALRKAQENLAEGKTTGVRKAAEAALKVCLPDPATHPVRQGEVLAARVNLEAVLDQLGGAKDDADDAADEPGYAKSTVKELKAELAKRGLAVKGKKGDLIAALEASDAGA